MAHIFYLNISNSVLSR